MSGGKRSPGLATKTLLIKEKWKLRYATATEWGVSNSRRLKII